MVWPYLGAAVYLGLVLAGGEGLRRAQWSAEDIRKFVHIATGNIILMAWGFEFPLWVCLSFCIPFTLLTLVSAQIPLLQRMDAIERKSWGTFYYALSITLLISYFWSINRPEFAALGILVMTWGDALAAIIGQRWGQNLYYIGTLQKSWEGTAVMALVSTLVSGLVLVSTRGLSPSVLICAVVVGFVAAGLEVFSQGGIDNLTVPLGSAALAWWWLG